MGVVVGGISGAAWQLILYVLTKKGETHEVRMEADAQ